MSKSVKRKRKVNRGSSPRDGLPPVIVVPMNPRHEDLFGLHLPKRNVTPEIRTSLERWRNRLFATINEIDDLLRRMK